MNFILFLYLNLIRGPRIIAEREAKEQEARRLQEEADRASGKLPTVASCKKCDAEIDLTKTRTDAAMPKCEKCQKLEIEERANAVAEVKEELKMTPFLWWQLFVMLVGIAVFFHRNVMPLY